MDLASWTESNPQTNKGMRLPALHLTLSDDARAKAKAKEPRDSASQKGHRKASPDMEPQAIARGSAGIAAKMAIGQVSAPTQRAILKEKAKVLRP